jgi:hypothetical protein
MLTTANGTISGLDVIYDKSAIEGTSRGESLYVYLDFVKGGAETPTFTIQVKESSVSNNYYTLSAPVSGVVTMNGYTLSATGKYAISVNTGKNVEAVKVAMGATFATSTLSVNFGLDNYYA